MKWVEKYHTITDIVGTVYCEQKVAFDREHGDTRLLEVQAKAAAGTFKHLRFQVEGQTRTAIDRCCFIVTAARGPDAVETGFLRAWRSRVLMPTMVGRLFTRTYYVVSPDLVPLSYRSRCAATAVYTGLDALLYLLEVPR